jgi:UDP-4-amino-4,6-dideoxy-N-acetyl-beta-L-altrosamine N-acetyltransferase
MPLRPLIESDLPLVLGWRNAPAVRQHMFTSHEISLAEHRAWFGRLAGDARTRVYVHQDGQGQADGVVSFTQIHAASRSAFWGFYTAPEAPRGTGSLLGIDAMDQGFDELGLHKLNAEVLASNEKSLRFHQKLGFQCEGTFRDAHFDGERYVGVVRFGILADEWKETRRILIQGLDEFARKRTAEPSRQCP